MTVPQPYPGQPVSPYGGQYVGKQRNGIAVVLLSIITFGIYHLVYCYKTGEEIKRNSGVGLGGAVMLILGLFIGIVVPFLFGNDVKNLRERAGMEPRVSALTGLWIILPLVGVFVFYVKLQNALNEYWQRRV